LIASQLFEVALLKTQLVQASLLFEQTLTLREKVLTSLPLLAVAKLALLLL